MAGLRDLVTVLAEERPPQRQRLIEHANRRVVLPERVVHLTDDQQQPRLAVRLRRELGSHEPLGMVHVEARGRRLRRTRRRKREHVGQQLFDLLGPRCLARRAQPLADDRRQRRDGDREERGNPEQRGAVPRHELAGAVGHAVDLCPNRTPDSEPLHVGGQFVNRRVSTVRLLAEGAQHDRIEVARQLARERTAADAARSRNGRGSADRALGRAGRCSQIACSSAAGLPWLEACAFTPVSSS